MPRSFRQDPAAMLDYVFDWSAWLAGDTIESSTITAPVGVTVTSSATSTAVTVWVSGGTLGGVYPVTCHIVTAAGREDDRTLTFRIGDM